MSRCLALALIAAAGVLCECRDSVADEARFPSHDVRIHVTLAADGRASVVQEYALRAPTGAAVFELLADECAEVGPILAALDDRQAAVTLTTGARGPWTTLRSSGAPATRSWRVFYDVTTLASEAAVPIVMPAGPLENEPGGRGARVHIDLRWTGTPGAARVVMPRLVPRSSGDVWEATMLAMPSAIRVVLPDTATTGSCRRYELGDAGGLEWRFSVFVLTMVVWMMAYLAWFGRPWAARS